MNNSHLNFGDPFNKASAPPVSHHPNANFQSQGMQEHDVVLEHLKVGDEVVWISDGGPVSIDQLDIGKVQRTVYNINKDTLFATVDFNDRVEDAKEIIDPRGRRLFRRVVHVKHLKRLGDFLEDNVKSPGGRTAKSSRLSYVVRPCILKEKLPTTHLIIKELDEMFNFYKGRVIRGSVRRMLTSEGRIYIGVEFESEVYTQELDHSPSCAYMTNGCEKRITINIANMTKMVWETEFRLIVNNKSKQATFEDLFNRGEEPPPSYFDVTSISPPPMYTNPRQFPIPTSPCPPYFAPTPTAPMLPYAHQEPENWANFNDEQEQKFGFEQYTTKEQPMSRAFSMMNLETVASPQVRPNRVSLPPQQNRQSSLVDELKSKLKIQIKPTQTRRVSNEELEPQVMTPIVPIMSPVNANPRHSTLLEELRLRQNRANNGNQDFQRQRPASVFFPENKSRLSREELVFQKPRPNPSFGGFNPPPSPNRLSRATSCLNIGTTGLSKPVLPPKPLTPKPKLVRSNAAEMSKRPLSFSQEPKITQNLPIIQQPSPPTAREPPPPLTFRRKPSPPPSNSSFIQPPSPVTSKTNASKDYKSMYPSLAQEDFSVSSFVEPRQPPSPPRLNLPDERAQQNLSRENLPPPPPPPPLAPHDIYSYESEDEDYFPPPPPPLEKDLSPEISLLQQIRQGITLHPVKDHDEDQESVPVNANPGLKTILQGAIQNRRIMMEDDASDSDDEDSDAWE